MVITSLMTSWRVVVPATSSGELSPFFFFSLSFLILKKMEVVGKKVEMVEKKLEVVGLEKEVEMVGVVGHYNSPPLIRNSSPNSCHKLTCPMSS